MQFFSDQRQAPPTEDSLSESLLLPRMEALFSLGREERRLYVPDAGEVMTLSKLPDGYSCFIGDEEIASVDISLTGSLRYNRSKYFLEKLLELVEYADLGEKLLVITPRIGNSSLFHQELGEVSLERNQSRIQILLKGLGEWLVLTEDGKAEYNPLGLPVGKTIDQLLCCWRRKVLESFLPNDAHYSMVRIGQKKMGVLQNSDQSFLVSTPHGRAVCIDSHGQVIENQSGVEIDRFLSEMYLLSGESSIF